MGGAAVAGQSRIVGDDAHRQVGIAYIRAHLFERAHAHERHHADDERDVPVIRQAGRYADHILLRDAGVDETVRIFLMKLLAAEADIRREQPDAAILSAKLRYRVAHHRTRGVIFIQSI